jgi:hypothetical protein
MPSLEREAWNDRFFSVPVVFSNINLVYAPRNTEEKQQGVTVTYMEHKMVQQFWNSQLDSLFHPRKYTVFQAKETLEVLLLMVYNKLEATGSKRIMGSSN